MSLKKLRSTPDRIRVYIFMGILLMALPSIASLYKGHTGKFIVSTGMIAGEPFHESVIYIQHHDFWGAFGVIINKPVESREFRKPFPELEWKVDLYNGGPVEYGGVQHLLLTEQNELPNQIFLANTSRIEEDASEAFELLSQKKNIKPYRLFVGYSGWGIFQLNRELSRGIWGVIDYDEALMFDTRPEDVWEKAMDKVLETRPAVQKGV